MNKETFMRALKAGKLTTALLMCALGALLVLVPGFSINTVLALAGIVVLAISVLKFMGYFSKGAYKSAYTSELIGACLTLVAALFLLYRPDSIVKVTMRLLGLAVMLIGLTKLKTAKIHKNYGLGTWSITLITGALITIAGLLLVTSPLGTVRTITVLIGIIVLVIGAGDIYVTLKETPQRRSPDVVEADYTEL